MLESIQKTLTSHGLTLHMFMLGCLNVLLSKYSSQDDIIIGVPIAGRSHPQTQQMMGMFVNTLCMRNHPIGEKAFSKFLQEVKENALQCYQHQDYQFEELVEKLQISRDISRNPIFDVLLNILSTDFGEVKFSSDVTIIPQQFDYQKTQVDLSLTIEERFHTLECSL